MFPLDFKRASAQRLHMGFWEETLYLDNVSPFWGHVFFVRWVCGALRFSGLLIDAYELTSNSRLAHVALERLSHSESEALL